MNQNKATPQPRYISGDTTIYVCVQSVEELPLRITATVQGHENTIYLDTDEATAKELSTRLHTVVGLAGRARWDLDTRHVVDFKIDKITAYECSGNAERFQGLVEKYGKYWNNIDDINELLMRD